LLLQLDPADPDYGLLADLVEQHLDACAAGRRRRVAQDLGVTLERLQELLLRLARLRTRPLDGEGEGAPTLRPEVRVRLHAGDLVVDLVRGSLPEVRVDHDLEVLARDRAADRATRTWLRPRVDEARRILDAVRQRQETLLLVAAAAARRQCAWLRAEAEHLAPLTMRSLAEELGLATSTVSRAVAGKALDTPRGVLPLRSLFQAEAPTAGVARLDARARVGALIAAEDPAQPLSDDAIAAVLAGEGLDLARRTVAKYRRELGLASSFERREVLLPTAAAR
ncbi:MAG: RNA polymerase sigma-54 factor, partial [Planctomycetota bacterium]|nr:RNA polymerase sigma-54 factor [Planctomycetota bacterium]